MFTDVTGIQTQAALVLACIFTFMASAGATYILATDPCWPACAQASEVRPIVAPSRTPTATPTPTKEPRRQPTSKPPTPFTALASVTPRPMLVRLSWYWPALGGTNCYPTNWITDLEHPYGGVCRTKLLGQPWSDWAGAGAACPPSVALRSRIYVERLKKSFYCVDRGGAIEDLPDGTKFIDLLQDWPITFPDWDKGIIVDAYCPRGCYVSEAYVH